jgi:hypothetical protein
MQAPKLTAFNGQTAQINVTEDQTFVTGLTANHVNGQVVYTPRVEPITTGLQFAIQPVISADRRFVCVGMKAEQRSVESPVPLYPIVTPIRPVEEGDAGKQPIMFTQFIQQPRLQKQVLEQKLCIPDGGTAIMRAWRSQCEVSNEVGVPIVSDIPYLGELFKVVRTHPESATVLVTVTPRVLAVEECEEHKTPAPAAKTAKASVGDHMMRFTEFFKEGKYQEAATCAQRACELDPDNAVAAAALQLARRHLPSPAPVLACPADLPLAYCPSAEKSAIYPSPVQQASFTTGAPDKVTILLQAYYQACAAGHLDLAKKMADEALAIDPTCFSKNKSH